MSKNIDTALLYCVYKYTVYTANIISLYIQYLGYPEVFNSCVHSFTDRLLIVVFTFHDAFFACVCGYGSSSYDYQQPPTTIYRWQPSLETVRFPSHALLDSYGVVVVDWKRSNRLRLKTQGIYRVHRPAAVIITLLLASGNIETNPGPVQYLCTVCKNLWRGTSVALCDGCSQWTQSSSCSLRIAWLQKNHSTAACFKANLYIAA